MTELRHIAIIMDGNGRWAERKFSSRKLGHAEGVKIVPRIIERALKIGLPCLTLFAFSCENWTRPEDEVSNILELIKRFISHDLQTLHEKNVRLNILGRRDNLDDSLVALFDQAESKTSENTGLMLNIAFNYSGRDDIIRAVNKLILADDLEVTEEKFATYLDTSIFGDPDLIIRTSGEMRLSNFLLWQAAYSELYFCDCYWPDFGVKHFDAAIKEYKKRKRTFGRLSNSN